MIYKIYRKELLPLCSELKNVRISLLVEKILKVLVQNIIEKYYILNLSKILGVLGCELHDENPSV